MYFFFKFGGFETITNALIDKYPEKLYSRRTLLALVVAVLLTLCGIPLTMSVSILCLLSEPGPEVIKLFSC